MYTGSIGVGVMLCIGNPSLYVLKRYLIYVTIMCLDFKVKDA
jgi:hypothetical protein